IFLLGWQLLDLKPAEKARLAAEPPAGLASVNQQPVEEDRENVQDAAGPGFGTAGPFDHTAYQVTGTPAPAVPQTGSETTVLSVPNTKNILLLDSNALAQAVDWSVDSRFLYAGVKNIGLVTVNTNMLSLTRIENSLKNITLITVDPAKTYVALADDEDRSIHLYSRQRQKMEKTLGPLHEQTPTAMVFSPNGKWLVSCAPDGLLLLWDVNKAEYVKTLYRDAVCSDITFTPSGLQLAAAFNDEGMVRLWDTATWKEMYSFPVDGVTDVAINPGGTRLLTATGDGFTDARVWNIYSGNLLMTLDDGSAVWAVAYSPNGRWLLTAGEGGRVSVWDPQTGALKYEFEADIQKITMLEFNPSGTMLAAAGDAVRLWKMSDLDLP
ncbi:MAG: WD40 repeat domain-containing protein, partial [Anaerolineaceae bacterium]